MWLFFIFTGMKRLLSGIFLLCLPTFGLHAQSKKIRVLFIGNSYTYVNNLPDLIKGIALANGDSVIYDSNCPGGFTFNNHYTNATTLAKISAGNWTHLVLQAQSQEPSFSPSQVASQTLPYAIRLDSLVKKYSPCATTVFYETWGRKNGDASNCMFYPPVCTYTGMQNRLKQSYKLFADSAHALMAPAGEAFRACVSSNTTINLYQADESHPSMEGSYLTAAVFYETLFQKSVLSNTYNPGINTSTLTFLQGVAHQVFRDSLALWNVGKNSPWAAFTGSVTGSTLSVSPVLPGGTDAWWFGDGSVSSQSSPQHTYAFSGTYTVSHVSTVQCKTDSASSIFTVTVLTTGIQGYEQALNQIVLFPNPTSEKVFVQGLPEGLEFTVDVLDGYGRLCLQSSSNLKIDVSSLPNGLYTLRIHNADFCRIVPLVLMRP
jgi:hypothetical protein